MFTLLVFIAVLATLVLAHEFGHFIVAKKSGCAVEEFGVGFPPRLFSFERGGTRYSINLLPFGGFVKIKGENGDETPDDKSFVTKSFGWKTFIISAGVLMNVVLAFALITITLIAGVPSVIDEQGAPDRWARISDQRVSVMQVIAGSPAEQAGLQPGESIAAIDGQPVLIVDDAIAQFANNEGKPLMILVKKGDRERTVELTPALLPDLNKVGAGVGLSATADIAYPWYVAPWYGLKRTFSLLWLIITSLADMFASLVSRGSVDAQIAGPIGIAVISGEAARLGIVALFQFAALLSLNLAIINILPIPALDGGRLAMIVLERVRGKALRANFERWVHVFGFAFLIMLMIAVTARDILHYLVD